MKFRRIWILWGPNVWSREPMAEAWADFEEHRGRLSTELPGFADRLLATLPGLAIHPGPDGTSHGFPAALERGLGLGFVLERVALELQTLAGHPLSFGRTVEESPEPGLCKVAIAYIEEPVVQDALPTALRLIGAAIDGAPFDLRPEIDRLAAVVDRNTLGRTTAAMVAALRRRGIPFEHIDPSDGRFLLIGWGARQRRLRASETDRTGAIASHLTTDKDLTKQLLATAGIPVPQGRIVADEDDAWAAAEEIGPPVAIKPLDRDLAVGVELNLSTRDEVVAGYRSAREKSRRVIVEKFAQGTEHRLLVVGGKLVAAAHIEPPKVVGDGRSTVAQLVEQANLDPHRDDAYRTPKARIPIDDKAIAALHRQGKALDSIPEAGETVVLRHDPPFIESGGDLSDVTDRVHPEVAERAIEAVRVVDLDVAGLDIVARDIGRPLEEQGGVIVEVNSGPGLWLHMEPYADHGRDVAGAIVASIMPEGQAGRIPSIAVTGVNGKTSTSRMIAHIARGSGKVVGLACTDGLFIQDRKISGHDCSGPHSARDVLRNPAVELAVLETARGGILREGLGFDLVDVAVVTNIGAGDHLGHKGIDTPEALAWVKSVPVKAVHPQGGIAVLNAADPLVAGMAAVCPGRVAYFAADGANPHIVAARAEGGHAAFVRGGSIVLAKGNEEEVLARLEDLPFTHGGAVAFQVENALAAALACDGLGVDRRAIRDGLASFIGGAEDAPGRFNVIRARGATLIVDYGHNADALQAVVDAIDRLPSSGRRSAVYSGCNRRDDDVLRQGEILGRGFDRVVLYADRDNTDREDGELNRLIRRGIARGDRAGSVDEYPEEFQAIEAALADLREGDLLVLGVSSYGKCLEMIRERFAGPNGTP
ncbi:MAG: cyanophycin synthetase [Isosphaeraceae bacterium]